MNKYTIIVAGGAGVRMGSVIPKQFILLSGIPLLMHTIKAFSNCNLKEIITVIPLPFIDYWKSLCTQYEFEIPHTIVPGGLFRSESVIKGLSAITDDEAIVAIHDGVRPLVTEQIINQAFQLAEENGSAVPYIDITESVRYINKDENRQVDRDKYKIIQTPQCFSLSVLKRIYNTGKVHSFTDDASLVEKHGIRINMFKGAEENIKITTPLDLIIAEAILNNRKWLQSGHKEQVEQDL